jgi:hypothetical protein
MTNETNRNRIAAVLVPLGFATALAAPGCGGSSSQKSTAESGSSGAGAATSGTGGSSAGSSSGSAGKAAGAGGSGNTGAVGGSLGEGGGGRGGSGGSSAVGGAGGASGRGGAGGAGDGSAGEGTAGSGTAGAGGQAGEVGDGGADQGGAGGGSSGAVGVLGTECSTPGALACAGHHQKLTVVCGGEGRWETNLTCGAGDFCDSTSGENAGTCRPELPECADGPGTSFCADEKSLVTCSADAVSTTTTACGGACHGDACHGVSECAVWDDYERGVACSEDCGRPILEAGSCFADNNGCVGVNAQVDMGERLVIRTNWADETCAGCDGASREIYMAASGTTPYGIRVTVPEPWRVRNSTECGVLSSCLVLSASHFVLVANSPGDGPVNVLVEALDAPGSCDPSDPSAGGAAGQVGTEEE